MPNLRICFRNIADSANISANPAFLAGAKEKNLQRSERGYFARTTSSAAQLITLSWPQAQPINFFHMSRHNLSSTATERPRLYATSTFSSLITPDPGAGLAYAYSGFSGDDLQNDSDIAQIKNTTRYLSQLYSTPLSATWEFVDSGGFSFMDFGRIFVGQYREVKYNPPFGGVPFTLQDSTTVAASQDGSLVSDKGYKSKKLELFFKYCDRSDWAWLLAGIRYSGKSTDVFVSVLPSDGTFLESYMSGVFKITEIGAFDLTNVDQSESKITLVEI